jgi:hypothetical protein
MVFGGVSRQQIFGLHSRLAIQQWSHPPDTKICAASLPNSQLLNSFVYDFFDGDLFLVD